MTTIKDIARISGYSIGTVSRVINHHPDVSDRAREVIERIIEEQHFQPNQNAKQLKASSESPVAVIIKGIENSFLNDLLVRVEERLAASGEEANVVFLSEGDNEVLTAVRMENESHPKGFVFLGGSHDNFQNDFPLVHTPSVLVSAGASDLDSDLLSSFSTDDYEGSRAAARLFVEGGRKNVGFISGHFAIDADGVIVSPRLKGAVDELQENGCSFDPDRQLVYSHFTLKEGYNAAKKLLVKYPEMDALFAHSDIMALGAMRALHDEGKKVPEEIAVCGYDGISVGDFSVPRLTTIRQDTGLMAERAVNDLLFRMNYTRKTVHELIPHVVVERESSGIDSDDRSF